MYKIVFVKDMKKDKKIEVAKKPQAKKVKTKPEDIGCSCRIESPMSKEEDYYRYKRHE